MIGTRQERSQSVYLRHWFFSPSCQPWSVHRTMTVFSACGPSSSAFSTRPTFASVKLMQAR